MTSITPVPVKPIATCEFRGERRPADSTRPPPRVENTALVFRATRLTSQRSSRHLEPLQPSPAWRANRDPISPETPAPSRSAPMIRAARLSVLLRVPAWPRTQPPPRPRPKPVADRTALAAPTPTRPPLFAMHPCTWSGFASSPCSGAMHSAFTRPRFPACSPRDTPSRPTEPATRPAPRRRVGTPARWVVTARDGAVGPSCVVPCVLPRVFPSAALSGSRISEAGA